MKLAFQVGWMTIPLYPEIYSCEDFISTLLDPVSCPSAAITRRAAYTELYVAPQEAFECQKGIINGHFQVLVLVLEAFHNFLSTQ